MREKWGSSRANINGFEFKTNSAFKNNWNENTSRQSEHRLEQVLRATDLLLESGGFGLIILDLADLPPQSARRIPLTTWFRFRRAIEHKPTILLAIEQHPIAGSCSSLLLQLGAANENWTQPLRAATECSPRRKPWVNPVEEQAPEGRKKITLTSPHSIFTPHAHLLTGLNIKRN